MELVGLLAFVLAILIGFKCMDYGLRFVLDYIGDLGKFLPFVGFILVFGLAFFVLLTSGKLAKKILDYTVFGSPDPLGSIRKDLLRCNSRILRVPQAELRILVDERLAAPGRKRWRGGRRDADGASTPGSSPGLKRSCPV